MPAQARLGPDLALVPADAHGCPACPHTCIGPAVMGSPDTLVNGMPPLRVTDMGVHAACCGPNTWVATGCSGTVRINQLGCHRLTDVTVHCGGVGTMIGPCSSNVYVGG